MMLLRTDSPSEQVGFPSEVGLPAPGALRESPGGLQMFEQGETTASEKDLPEQMVDQELDRMVNLMGMSGGYVGLLIPFEAVSEIPSGMKKSPAPSAALKVQKERTQTVAPAVKPVVTAWEEVSPPEKGLPIREELELPEWGRDQG
jgi:hypothetical protein